MGKKVEINLVVSQKMSECGENDCIRFTRRAREYLGLSTQSIRLGKGDAQRELRIRQAYREDVQALARLMQQGKISEEDALTAAFVSKDVRKGISPTGKTTTWVTDGIGNITIGCDPEFGLIDSRSNTLVRGDQVLPESKNASFGEDGPGVEVRPAPSRDHIKLVDNIRSVLNKAPDKAKNFLWLGGATFRDNNRTYWFGGHIHLGRPGFVSPQVAEPCFNYIARVLDHMLALPLVTFDKPEPHLRRNGCAHKYGKAGDIRIKGEGNEVRFEYRVPSGLWLTHPTLSKIVLGAAKAITEAAYSQINTDGFDPDDNHTPTRLGHKLGIKYPRQVAQIINSAEVGALEPTLLELWEKQIRGLETYEEYAPEIDALIELVKASPTEVVSELNLDLRKNWQDGNPLLPNARPKLKSALHAVEIM